MISYWNTPGTVSQVLSMNVWTDDRSVSLPLHLNLILKTLLASLVFNEVWIGPDLFGKNSYLEKQLFP